MLQVSNAIVSIYWVWQVYKWTDRATGRTAELVHVGSYGHMV
jgi:hypothetical protein